MQTSKRRLLLAAWAAAFAAVGGARAHGVRDHSTPPRSAGSEQRDWGMPGDAARATRTIEVLMLDSMRFEPSRVKVRLGETVRFVHRNRGQVMHEFVIGTRPENDKHAAMMAKFPGMEHDEPFMAHVAPGTSAEIVWTFNRAGTFEFACLIAGHYQAGMFGTIEVAAA